MKAHPTMEILPFGDAYLVAGCSVLKGRSPRGAVPKVWDAVAPSRPPGAVSRLGGRPQELLESHLVTSPAFPQPHTVLAHGLQAGLGSTAQRVLAEWSHQHWQSSPTPQAAGTAGWPWITQQQELTQALGILPAAPGALLTPGHLGQQLSAPYQRWEDTAG